MCIRDRVVIDEMSMVDDMLFESLLLALKPACKIIMVGDEDQLPSVGEMCIRDRCAGILQQYMFYYDLQK